MMRHRLPGPVLCRALTPLLLMPLLLMPSRLTPPRWAVSRRPTLPMWLQPRPWPVLVTLHGPRACDRAAGRRANDESQDNRVIAQQAQLALVGTRRCSAIRWTGYCSIVDGTWTSLLVP